MFAGHSHELGSKSSPEDAVGVALQQTTQGAPVRRVNGTLQHLGDRPVVTKGFGRLDSQRMNLVDLVFDVYKSRGAFDPGNGRPLHSLYRYSGPLGPAYVGWTEADLMMWIEGPQIRAANLDSGRWRPGDDAR